MKLRRHAPWWALLVVALALPAGAGVAWAGQWACPPCGMDCDRELHVEPGTCPACGATLVAVDAADDGGSGAGAEADPAPAAPAAAPVDPRPLVAIVVFPGVQIIDFAAPYEVFGQGGYRVVTVARDREPIETAMGLTITPARTFDDCPPPAIVVVPGGNVDAAAGDPAAMAWIARTSGTADYTLSVCNGAFLLARDGLLDGLTATTFYGLLDQLAADYPKVHVVDDRRFVDNGRVITTAGLSSGIEGALHVLERTQGAARAREIALHIEYDWRPGSGWARGALADLRLPRLDRAGLGEVRTVATDGDREHWTRTLRVRGAGAPAEVAERITRQLAGANGWRRADGARKDGALTPSQWTFTDPRGRPWAGTLEVRPDGDAEGACLVTIGVRRQG